jgi:short-subunit dehydrogenase
MKDALKSSSVIITGASGGIGEQMAYEVAKRGGAPILLARSKESLARISEKIDNDFGIKAPYLVLDVSDRSAIKETFASIIEHHGPIDVLINNAGYGKFEYAVEGSIENFEGMFEVNVLGLIACTKAVLPHMIERQHGHIVNIASQAAKIATPKSSGYAATKHAVLGFTNSLRMEVEDEGIFVTAVNPGPIKTNFFDVADESGQYQKNVERFMLDPKEVASKTVSALFTKKREINLPSWMNVGSTFYQVFPRLVEKLGGNAFKQK